MSYLPEVLRPNLDGEEFIERTAAAGGASEAAHRCVGETFFERPDDVTSDEAPGARDEHLSRGSQVVSGDP